MMKKLLSVVLCGLMVATLSGCGSTKTADTSDKEATASVTKEVSSEASTVEAGKDSVVNTEDKAAQASTDTEAMTRYIKDGNVEFHNNTGSNWYADIKLPCGDNAHVEVIGDKATVKYDNKCGKDNDRAYQVSYSLSDKRATLTDNTTYLPYSGTLKKLDK